MRNLSVVAILLGVSVACSNQPAATVPSDRDGCQTSRQRPRESNGSYGAAPIHAVAVVARGADGSDVVTRPRRWWSA
jgi:hypothetical protein